MSKALTCSRFGLACALALAFPVNPVSGAELTSYSADAPGTGVWDTTPPDPASAAGGNPGETLGEQRQMALEYALGVWGAALPASIPVSVEVELLPLACAGEQHAQLGNARAGGLYADFEGALREGTWYPAALANHLAGVDLDPEEPEIKVRFNVAIDSECLAQTGWYYGLDGVAQNGAPDFVSAALHELAHGLGFALALDPETFEYPEGLPGVFSHYALNLEAGQVLSELGPEERRQALTHVRSLVWAGAETQALAQRWLRPGAPRLELEPPLEDTAPIVTDAWTPQGLDASADPESLMTGLVSGAIQVPSDATACSSLPLMAEAVALVFAGSCSVLEQVRQVEEAGAKALLLASGQALRPPGDWGGVLTELQPNIPVWAMSDTDAARLALKLQGEMVTAHLLLTEGYRGALPDGRIFLNATSPFQEGSTGAHWDPAVQLGGMGSEELLGVSLLMEPQTGPRSPELDLTVAALRDLGWGAPLRQSAAPEGAAVEAADAGEAGSPEAADAAPPNGTGVDKAGSSASVLTDGETVGAKPRSGTGADFSPEQDSGVRVDAVEIGLPPEGSCSCRVGGKAPTAASWCLGLVFGALGIVLPRRKR